MSDFKQIEIPTRENPYAGPLYNLLVERFPLIMIENDDTHKKAKELFLNLLRHKKESGCSPEEIGQINAFMGSLKLLIVDYEAKAFSLDIGMIPEKALHPGAILQFHLDELNLSIETLAQRVGCEPGEISDICRGTQGISREMAIRIADALGTTPELWMNAQKNWELSQASS